MTTLGVVSVATNHYIHYWEKMVESFQKNVKNFEITFHVFTEQIEYVSEFCINHPELDIKVHKIEALGWPFATLYRYKLISSISDQLSEEILMHLDADMLVLDDFDSTFNPDSWVGGIGLVAHPGYWRPRGRILAKFYTQHPKRLLADLRSVLDFGGLGSWCDDRKSGSFVPKKERKTYYCGGTWMGRNADFKSMVRVLNGSVAEDEAAGIIATWHDESHLNKWAISNAHSTLTPSYCYDPSYPNLRSQKEIIRAVDKNVTPK